MGSFAASINPAGVSLVLLVLVGNDRSTTTDLSGLVVMCSAGFWYTSKCTTDKCEEPK